MVKYLIYPAKCTPALFTSLNCRSEDWTICSLAEGDQTLYLYSYNTTDTKQPYCFIKKYESVPCDVISIFTDRYTRLIQS